MQPRACLAAFFLLSTGLRADPADCPYENWDAREKSFAERLGAMVDPGSVPLEELDRQLTSQARFPMEFAAPPAVAPESTAALYRACRPAVVAVGRAFKCGKCDHWHVSAATGFVVRGDGVIATNFHVLEKDDTGKLLGVRLQDGSVYPVKAVLASDRLADVALLKIEAEGLPVLPLAGDVEIGEPVFVISHPVGAFYTFTEGLVSNKFERRRRGQSWREISITADFAKGSSGGPVLNRAGAVVGMVRATESTYYDRKGGAETNLQMVWKLCVPADAIRALAREAAAPSAAPEKEGE